MREDIKRDYAEMFITMSYDYIKGGITWETFVRNTEIAANNMKLLADVTVVTPVREHVG